MEILLSRIKDAGLDATALSGEEAIVFWNHVRDHVATTPLEKAQCLLVSAEYRSRLNQTMLCIEDLRGALSQLQLPADSDWVLAVHETLSDRYIELGEYTLALNEYIELSNLAVEHSSIDSFAFALAGMGQLCHLYGDARQALKFYEKVKTIDHAISSRALRLRYKVDTLACLVALNRTELARALITECEELSILVSDKSLTGQIAVYESQLASQSGQHKEAVSILANASLSYSGNFASQLSALVKLELADLLYKEGKEEYSTMVLSKGFKKLDRNANPRVACIMGRRLAELHERNGEFKKALHFEKTAFQIETDLMKRIPIGELGSTQLRRLSRFELQLKLILSEIENKELKETTESQKNTVAQLQQDVFTDPLTKLHNRRWLDTKLKDLLLHNTRFAFLVVDIDHFKSINDELSHLVGDKAIVKVSSELARYFKFKNASCVRFGGEEFLVILENATLAQAQAHAENYRQRIYDVQWANILGERGLTVSIGVTLHHEGENTQRTFYRADKALYRAKANGRNQVCSEA
jgi:diguanylate cyclase (GGDEF)-like protein